MAGSEMSPAQKLAFAFRIVRRRRGWTSENIADQALTSLAGNGAIISSWWPATNSEDRVLGIDRHVLRVSDGQVINLQIKASPVGQKKHLKNHPDVPCVVIEPGQSLEEAAAALARAILSAP